MYLQRNEGVEEGAKAFRYLTIIPLNFISQVEESTENETGFQLMLEDETTLFIAPTSHVLVSCTLNRLAR